MSFSIGVTPEGRSILVDRRDFMASNTLVFGQTRSGKSHTTRLLIEALSGHCPIFVFDREGEYVTLRDRFPFLLVGDGWDIDVAPENAGALAQKLLELGASAIIDLSTLQHKKDLLFVQNFVEGVMRLKTKDWRDAMFVFDEAQLLAPEGKETPCGNAVIDLAKRGLKRGFFSVVSTQRLPELSKAVVSQLDNAFTGRTSLDIDVARSGGRLQLSKERVASLRTLVRGQFYVAGVSIRTPEVGAVLVNINDTVTHSPSRQDRGAAIGPPTGKVLEAVQNLKTLETASNTERTAYTKEQDLLKDQVRALSEELAAALGTLQRLRDILVEGPAALPLLNTDEKDGATKLIPQSVAEVVPAGEPDNAEPLRAGETRLLQAFVSFHPKAMTFKAALFQAGISTKSSNGPKFLRKLIAAGYVVRTGAGDSTYRAQPAGLSIAGNWKPVPLDLQGRLKHWQERLEPSAAKLLEVIVKHTVSGKPLSVADALEAAQISPTSSNATKHFRTLQGYGLIERSQNYKVHASQEFIG